MSEKDIETTPAVEVKEEVKPAAEATATPAPATDADSTVDYWANAWANRGV